MQRTQFYVGPMIIAGVAIAEGLCRRGHGSDPSRLAVLGLFAGGLLLGWFFTLAVGFVEEFSRARRGYSGFIAAPRTPPCRGPSAGRRFPLMVLVFAALAATSSLQPPAASLAADIFIGPAGSDNSGLGTADFPWLTIRKAVTSAHAGDTIWLKGGLYRFTAGQRYTMPRGLNNIRLRAVIGEKPVLDGNGLDYGLAFSDNAGWWVEGLTFQNVSRPWRIFSNPGVPGAHDLLFTRLTVKNAGRPGDKSSDGRFFQAGDYADANNPATPPYNIQLVGFTFEGCSGTGIRLLGPVKNVLIANGTIASVDDGHPVGLTDADGLTASENWRGLPAGLVIRNVAVKNVGEDGFDLTSENTRLENCSVTGARCCGVKGWRRATGGGPYFFTNVVTANCGECGAKFTQAPDVWMDSCTFAGAETGVFFKRYAATRAAEFTARYCLFDPNCVLDTAPNTLNSLTSCASTTKANLLVKTMAALPLAATRPANPLAADFNGDGRVDGLDFLIWQRGFNRPGSLSDGDANGDGFVDGADLAIWQEEKN
jgi:hypothetical protein